MALRLTLEEVSYSYPLPGEEEAPAITDLSLDVEPGEVLCVAGANGSGKSTLAQVCAGLLAPTNGIIRYGEEAIKGRAKLLAFRRRVGLVFQCAEDQLFADTVLADIAFGPHNHGLRGGELDASVRKAARLTGLDLDELQDRSPFSLSEGEKRRVALAGVLALEPELLILDEPFIGLDCDGSERLKESLVKYRAERDASIVIVTHELSNTWTIAERFALLVEGRLSGIEDKSGFILGDLDLVGLGMMLPQWGVLARELLRSGVPVSDPADPAALARAMAQCREALNDR